MKTLVYPVALLSLLGCSRPTVKDSMTLNQDFPVIDGNYRLSEEWQVTLPGKFNKRIEDGSLVIWRPGFTIWTLLWGNDNNEIAEQRPKRITEMRRRKRLRGSRRRAVE